MKIYHDLGQFDKNLHPVVAIGNFDGVHKGHQALLDQARQVALARDKKLIVLTFEPHPRSVFRPDDPSFRLTPEPVKTRLLELCSIDGLVILKFDWDFASQTAEDFIQDILIDGLHAAHVVVGEDFRFGQLRRGDAAMIHKAGLDVTTIDKQPDAKGEAVSSSRIRQALRIGDLKAVRAMLGRDWGIEGCVVHGDKRGRELGYPTANVLLGDLLHPAYGIYASLVRVAEDGPWLKSVTNIGIRPMFEISHAQVESFIFDFDQDIYDKIIQIRPVLRLRGEAKFDSLDRLIQQMEQDCAQAREVLSTWPD